MFLSWDARARVRERVGVVAMRGCVRDVCLFCVATDAVWLFARARFLAGSTINAGIDASKVVITKLHMDKDRKALLARKGGNANSDDAMQNVE